MRIEQGHSRTAGSLFLFCRRGKGMRETHNRGFNGVWIPEEIWLANDLGWSEKSLDGEQGCRASNNYLATFISLSKGRVSKLISSLKDKGYVIVYLIYKLDAKVIDRHINKTTRGYVRTC